MHPPGNLQPKKYLMIFLLAAGLGWIWFSRVPATHASQPETTAPAKGFQAPNFTLQTSLGEQVSLKDLRGQAVIINLWATWCSPCRAEMPALQRVYETYQDRGLIVLAVNATNQDDPGKALDFARELSLTFPILLDINGDVSALYRLQSLPTTFFVDPLGEIQEVVIGGPMSEALLNVRAEKLLQVVQP